jgi:hypothetical protein
MSPLYRSEAFAEDLLEAKALASPSELANLLARWIVNALPLAVALLGVAFAVVPPLA